MLFVLGLPGGPVDRVSGLALRLVAAMLALCVAPAVLASRVVRVSLTGGGGLVHLRSRVRADREGGSQSGAQDVLDWRFVGVMA